MVTFICGIVRGTWTAQLFDFNIAATLISFILFGNWLESKAKASTGDAIASLLALEAPTALLIEGEDGVLVEREFDAKLLLECIASYLVLSTDEQTCPNFDQMWNSCCFRSTTARDMKSSCIASFLVFEHDERHDNLSPNYDQCLDLVAFDP